MDRRPPTGVPSAPSGSPTDPGHRRRTGRPGHARDPSSCCDPSAACARRIVAGRSAQARRRCPQRGAPCGNGDQRHVRPRSTLASPCPARPVPGDPHRRDRHRAGNGFRIRNGPEQLDEHANVPHVTHGGGVSHHVDQPRSRPAGPPTAPDLVAAAQRGDRSRRDARVARDAEPHRRREPVIAAVGRRRRLLCLGRGHRVVQLSLGLRRRQVALQHVEAQLGALDPAHELAVQLFRHRACLSLVGACHVRLDRLHGVSRPHAGTCRDGELRPVRHDGMVPLARLRSASPDAHGRAAQL